MIDLVVDYWPYWLLGAAWVILAVTAVSIANSGQPPARRQPPPEHHIQAGAGFRLVNIADARADARARLGESTARRNTRPVGSCDNVTPIRRPPGEVGRVDDGS